MIVPLFVLAALVVAGADCRLVRGLFFDKTPGANWPVAWHQDLTLAVAERREIAGWSNWSVKAGVPHVQPPVDILERMVTLRLQLDDCGADNGPLRVLPGSHCLGRIGRRPPRGFARRNPRARVRRPTPVRRSRSSLCSCMPHHPPRCPNTAA